MRTRIISGVIGALLALAVLIWGGEWGFVAAAALLGTVAVFELLRAAEFSFGYRLPAMAAALAAPLLLMWRWEAALLLASVYLLYVMVIAVACHNDVTPEKAGLLCLLPLVAGAGFTALAALRLTGLFYVILVLVIPWLSDTGAYFTGVCCGKHKLCPVISPKKTVEGLVGGILTSVAASALTAWLFVSNYTTGLSVNWPSLLAVALVGAPLSVFGDLFASVVKRRFGVKDYGRIIPGHGGVMDRFDSVLPVAILVLLWQQVWPLMTRV